MLILQYLWLIKMQKCWTGNDCLKFFEACKIDIWLIPKGNVPFRMANWIDEIPHSERKRLFDQELRNSFLNNYDLINSSKFFDIYKCRRVNG